MTNEVAVKQNNAVSGFNTSEGFELIQRQAKLLASSTLVPREYQNNMPNCVIALNMANRIGCDPLMAIQNLDIIHGRPGWSSKFMIACFNQSRDFSSLRYEFSGEPGSKEWGCAACAVELSTGEKLYGTKITMAMADAEKWTSKAGSKWKTMPEQMLRYRAAAWFIRAYAPEIAMGLHTSDELREMDAPQTVDVKVLEAEILGEEVIEDQATTEEEKVVGHDMVQCPISGDLQMKSDCENCDEKGQCNQA